MSHIFSSKNSKYKLGLRRLYSARASVAASAIVLIGITIYQPSLFWLCLGGLAIILVATLVTSRSRKVSELRQMVERRSERTWPRNAMKSVTEALDNPVIIFDNSGILRYANVASERTFGPINLGDPISFKFRTPQMVQLVDAAIATAQRQMMVYEEQVTTKRWFSVECSAIPKTKIRNGRIQPSRFFLLSFTDLTQMRKTEQMRSDFVANASHELRTPLASLRGYIETLQGAAKDDKKARGKFLTIMLEQAERMSRLIDDLLSLSRIEMKAHMLPREKVDLAKILEHVKTAVAPSAKQYGTRLIVSGTNSPINVAGDRDELIQVFTNLVENACKYGRENGTVNVVLNDAAADAASLDDIRDEDAIYTVSVLVSDDGPGVAREHIPRLTERFYRAQNNDNAANGTGLGLAIVKHIVNRHQAKLIIDSTPGAGTRVTVSFRTPN